MAISRFRGKPAIAVVLLSMVFLFAGYVIHLEENAGDSLGGKSDADLYREYVSVYGHLKNLPQPRITSARFSILEPSRTYKLMNCVPLSETAGGVC